MLRRSGFQPRAITELVRRSKAETIPTTTIRVCGIGTRSIVGANEGTALRGDVSTLDRLRRQASPLRNLPNHIDSRKTCLDMELCFHNTMSFDKSHTSVHREVLCHCRVR